MELAPCAPLARPISPSARRAGWILTGLVVLFLLFSASLKLLRLPPALAAFEELGYPAGLCVGIGVLELACTLLYAWTRTSRIGAVLLTGYLGGAVTTHLRLYDPWLTHTLFPIWVGALAWLGLVLRDRGVRALLSHAPIAGPAR
jgi:hypothetical protein